MKPVLEIAVFTISAALQATAAGADRIELCENPADGGTTPSYGTLKTAREKIDIPVFPIIRPRGGDFLYTDEEFDSMKKDIQLCRSLQFEGIATGMLKTDGHVDTDRMKILTEMAYPMDITFHRAFDRCADPFTALEELINCGCSRILTSGQVPDAFDGKELIRKLVLQADERIIIMPGSGVRSNNILELATFTGASELHTSARQAHSSLMEYRQTSMQENMSAMGVNKDEIVAMKQLLSGHFPPAK